MTNNAAPRVVVLGGGFAGLESAFLLRARLGERVRLTLVSDEPAFLFKPNTIYIPFGGSADALRIPLHRPAAKRDIDLVRAWVRDVDPDARTVSVDGSTIPYDYLVVATGAAMAPEEIPGLAAHAETVWTPDEMASLGRRLRDVVAAARRGEQRRLLFLVPPGNKCAGPLYELVLMTETWLRRLRVRDAVDIAFTTVEPSFIAAFGPKLHDVVTAEFARRGIAGRTSTEVARVEADRVVYDDWGQDYDLLVAFPPYVSAVHYGGLRGDERGFLATELPSRRVLGQERVYAPGDAGDFPVKQAFLAFLQADAAAEHIAADVTGAEPALRFDPISMCVMEELDTATFAQVPLVVTGDSVRPVAVRPYADGLYKVGVSPLWRLGKKALGLYLPMRFNAGLPFHAGAPWRAMELGLKGMSAALARR